MPAGVLSLVALTLPLSCGSSDPPAASGDARAIPTATTTNGDAASPPATKGETAGYRYAFTATSVAIRCEDSAAKLRASGAAIVTFGSAAVVAGYEQVSANEQDPIVARLEGDSVVFCEHTKRSGGPDARAYGLTWNGGDGLYGVFTIVGGGTEIGAAAKDGWIASYGDGGASAKVMVVGKLSATTGVLERATYVPARLTKNGQLKTNSSTPSDAVHVLADGSLEIFANTAFCSLNPDRTSMCKEGTQDYPKSYRARLSPDLSKMTCASAMGVSNVAQPCE